MGSHDAALVTHFQMKILLLLIILIIRLNSEKIGGAQPRNDSKIQGGQNVNDIKQFPFIGFYEVSVGDNIPIRTCTGIIVNQIIAITAGHCVVVDQNEKPFRLLPLTKYQAYISMGTLNPSHFSDPSYERRYIKRVAIHPKAQFNSQWLIKSRNDIGAMLWLKKLVFNAKIQSVPLIQSQLEPEKVIVDIIKAGGHCEIPSWGDVIARYKESKKEGTGTATLQVSNFDVIAKYTCCSAYFKKNYDECMQTLGVPISGFLCHVPQKLNTSTTLGDAGAPLYCPYKGKKYVIGMNVESEGPNGSTNVNTPAYFVTAGAMQPYIKNITGSAGGLTNGIEKENAARIGLMQILAVFTWSLRL